MQSRINHLNQGIKYINDKIRNDPTDIAELLQKRETLIAIKNSIATGGTDIAVCGVTGGCGAAVVNPTVITGALPVIDGGTGLSSWGINAILLGNGTATPTIQTLDGVIVDTISIQSISNKILDGACNTITATYLYSGNDIITVNGPPSIGEVLTIQNITGNAINATWQVNTGTSMGIIPVTQGGTGLTYLPLNGVLIGNSTSIPTFQTIIGNIIDSASVQSIANKIIDANCNTISNISLQSSIVGVLPIFNGGTGLSSITLNGILVGNNSSTPTIQTLNGSIIDSASVQSVANKIIDANCNTISNISLQSSVVGVLPVISGGTGYSSITLNGILIGNNSSTPTIQTLNGSVVDTTSIQQLSGKIINGNCNTITNIITTISGVLPIIQGGTGYSSITLNGVLIGNNSSTPTIQILNGTLIDSASVQSFTNKIINANCNTISNISLQSSVVGVLPISNGGTGRSSITLNGVLIGNNSSTPTIQTLNGTIIDSASIQSFANKIIDGNCNTLTNIIATISGILPVINGGTGYSSIALNGILIGNNSSIPTIQTLNGAVVDTNSVQSFANKIIDGNCNTLTNLPLSPSIGFGSNVLTNSTVTITNPLIKSTSVITVSYNSLTTVSESTQGVLYIGNIIPATSFTVNSNKVSDNNGIFYICIY